MKNLKNKIEGIIFISDAPVKAKEIAEFLKEDLIKVKAIKPGSRNLSKW